MEKEAPGVSGSILEGLDEMLTVPRLFILDGAKALSKAVRATVGRQTLIQRCQVHKARNITEQGLGRSGTFGGARWLRRTGPAATGSVPAAPSLPADR